MSNIYFISDTHFGHNDISNKFRINFSSDIEHDEYIHHNILSKSGKRNILWLLGDICLNHKRFNLLQDYVKYFQQVNIVLGNHDHKLLYKYCAENHINIYGLVKKYNCFLSHCPIHTQELYRVNLNIHGHLHASKLQNNENFSYRYFCVSCEHINYIPISLSEIKELNVRNT